MNAPHLSMIVAWCNRDELGRTLPHNASECRKVGGEILIVNAGGEMALLERLVADEDRDCTRIIDAKLCNFNKSFALNIGAHLSTAAVVSVLDADVFLEPDLLPRVLATVNDQTFVTLEWMHESEAFEATPELRSIASITEAIRSNVLELRFHNGKMRTIRTYRYNELTGSRTGLSLVFVPKKWLLAVEGFNSDLRRWGWEDNDFHLRLVWSSDLQHIEMGSVVHLSHGDEKRALDGASQMQAVRQNLAHCIERYARGEMRGSFHADVAAWEAARQDTITTAVGGKA